jgi:hypothetical protein
MKRLLLLSLASFGTLDLLAGQSCPRGEGLRRRMDGTKHCVDVSGERSIQSIQACHGDQEYVCDPVVEHERGKAKCACVDQVKKHKKNKNK